MLQKTQDGINPLFFIVVTMVLLVTLSGPVRLEAAEITTPGNACTTGLSRADWDAIYQCVSGAWRRAALWVGASSDTCDSSHGGILQWTGSAFQVCNGSKWTAVGGGGGGNYYGIQSQTNVKRSTLVYSNTLQFNAATSATVSVSGDGSPALSIAGGSWVTSGTISHGQSIQLRMTSSASDSTTYTATFLTGSDTMTWTVTTAPLSAYLGGGSSHFITECATYGGSLTTPSQLGYQACQFASGCASGWSSTGWRYYSSNYCNQDWHGCNNYCYSPTGWYNYTPYCNYCNRTCEENCGCGCSYPTCYSSASAAWCI